LAFWPERIFKRLNTLHGWAMHTGIESKVDNDGLPAPQGMRLAPVRAARGFTLIELMVVVAIVAILAAIALPSYQQSVRKSRRADAMLALQQIQIEQEKLRAQCTGYAGTLTGTRACGTLGYPKNTSPDDYYTLALSGESATGFTATATAVSGKSQNNDAGCTVMTLAVSGLAMTKTPATCWSQ
jgi:type IV pilus assembly protein PilE